MRILLAILWFVVSVVVINYVLVPVIVWAMTVAGLTGFPVEVVAKGAIIIIFIYLVIGIVSGWRLNTPWDRTII